MSKKRTKYKLKEVLPEGHPDEVVRSAAAVVRCEFAFRYGPGMYGDQATKNYLQALQDLYVAVSGEESLHAAGLALGCVPRTNPPITEDAELSYRQSMLRDETTPRPRKKANPRLWVKRDPIKARIQIKTWRDSRFTLEPEDLLDQSNLLDF